MENIRNITLNDYIEAYFSDKKPYNWAEINTEMYELIGGNERDICFNIQKQMLLLQIKALIRELMGEKPSGSEKHRAKILEHDLKALTQAKKNEQMTRERFAVWILHVSKWVGYSIKQNEITLFDFLIASKEMQKEVAHKLKQQQK